MIRTSSDEAVAVPGESVVQFNEKSYIFIFKGNRQENGKTISHFEAIEVEKGATDQGFTEIKLPAGFDLVNVKVVVKGAYSVLSAWKNAGEMAC
jgi:cobalt-zinc-cadmium efflux system membrane fusion protein